MAAIPIVDKNILIHAALPVVWQALTDPQLIRLWWFDEPITVTTSWQPGTAMQFTGTFHGKPFLDKGIVLDVQPPRLLRYSHWSHLSGTPDSPQHYTVLTYQLHPDAGTTTTLHLTQENFHIPEAYHHANYFWMLTLHRLKKLLEGK